MTTRDFTADELRHRFRYDPDTGLFYRAGSADDAPTVGFVRNGYVHITVRPKQYRAHRLAWLYVHGVWPTTGIDHIDGDKMNNRIANLREADATENNQNLRTAKSTSKSGLIGAFLESATGKYRVTIRVRGKNWNVGRYDTAEEAHAVYVAAKRKVHSTCTL